MLMLGLGITAGAGVAHADRDGVGAPPADGGSAQRGAAAQAPRGGRSVAEAPSSPAGRRERADARNPLLAQTGTAGVAARRNPSPGAVSRPVPGKAAAAESEAKSVAVQELSVSSSMRVDTAPADPVEPVAVTQATTIDAAARDSIVAAVTAGIDGALEAAAAAPVAMAAPGTVSQGVAEPVASVAEALQLWSAALSGAITSSLAERIRQSALVSVTSTGLNLGAVNLSEGILTGPALTYTYTTNVAIDETITLPGQAIPVLGVAVDPINLSFDDGNFGMDVSAFTLPQTTLRVPDVTVQIGSPDTTVGVTVTVKIGGASGALSAGNVIPEIPISITGAITVDVPVEVTAGGPIQIDGFDLTGVNGWVDVNSGLLAFFGLPGPPMVPCSTGPVNAIRMSGMWMVSLQLVESLQVPTVTGSLHVWPRQASEALFSVDSPARAESPSLMRPVPTPGPGRPPVGIEATLQPSNAAANTGT